MGPVLVIAGAGSGKTKMLTARIVHLMGAHNVPANNILAVTFTNKAAGEMRERVSRALGLHPDALTPPPPWMTRLNPLDAADDRHLSRGLHAHSPPRDRAHSLYAAVRDLRRQRPALLVKDCFSRLNLSEKTFSPKSFQYSINSEKCPARGPHESRKTNSISTTKNLAKVYDLYQKEMFPEQRDRFRRDHHADLSPPARQPGCAGKIQQLYQFIHVDEYQDTNRAQYFCWSTCSRSAQSAATSNICVVGDEDQSIYKWRGADIKNILDFETGLPRRAGDQARAELPFDPDDHQARARG